MRPHLLGLLVDPLKTKFTAAHGKGCKNCIFNHERSTVCHQAAKEALARGMPDCEYKDQNGKSVIYIAVEIDVRQQELFDE